MSNVAVIIPARINSSRLPKKALEDINGATLIQRAVKCALKIKNCDVYVATDSESIVENLKEINFFNCIITDSNLPSGTDRIAAALENVSKKYDFVVNIQGDMPFFDHGIIEKAIEKATKLNLPITTLMYKTDPETANNTSRVKVVFKDQSSEMSKAIYFSRSMVPHGSNQYSIHVGVYIYRTDILKKFVELQPSNLEKQESLEQLRAISNSIDIFLINISENLMSIDNFEDLKNARKVLL
jgi:3-deoxy-manno-octulosonate cytidylyltransferase (CMP-KDO synthetase)